MENKISVIVPVYNVKEYLERCLKSVVEQSYPNLEIILVDDGSTDGSGELCDQWKEKDWRVKVIHKENGGLSSARNVGMKWITGEFFCFVDADDWIAKDYCESMLAKCLEYDCNLAICSFVRSNGCSSKIESNNSEKILTKERAMHYLDNRIEEAYVKMTVAWNKLYHVSLRNVIQFPEGCIHEDEYVIMDVLLACERIVWMEEGLYFYFQRADSITGASQKKNEQHCDVLWAYKHRQQQLLKAGYKELAANAWRNRMSACIEFLESKNMTISDEMRCRLRKEYKEGLKEAKAFVAGKRIVKYSLYLRFPGIYKKLFGVRDV
ncbi:MAG: glycosyltransferase family 2 protein [Lachnospiraceae bacterium]|nr:glycosyltransferase family 2 protein [Lachnospiraceae bacterium]